MIPTDAENGLLTGMDVLIAGHPDWIRGARIGLVSHLAAVNRSGQSSADRLRSIPGINVAALFGPEHGFRGTAPAGESTADERHTGWNIPVYSLYGENRAPSKAMLETIDLLVVEFQDLGARPYTYVSTLRLVLEAAAAAGKPVIVADRPIPLPLRPDGPMLDPRFSSFVAMIPAPMHYAMTPGETSLFLNAHLRLGANLRVAPMRRYRRETLPQPGWPPWSPPSPRIRSWDSACLFTTTVFGEALPALDYGSGTGLAFQVLGAPWLDAAALIAAFHAAPPPGIALTPLRYRAASGLYEGAMLDGIRLTITSHSTFRPVTTSVILLDCIQRIAGNDPLWSAPGTRPEWFDKLYGANHVREALQSGISGHDIAASWEAGLAEFERARTSHLLYPSTSPA